MPYKNPEDRRRRSREYHHENRERILERKKNYYLENKENDNAKSREWYKKNKDTEHYKNYSSENTKKWKRDNREKVSSQTRTRQARKKGLTPEMNKAELVEIESMYMYNHIMPGDWHVDHIKPLAAGGLHHPSNLQVLSKFDNLTKGAKWNI